MNEARNRNSFRRIYIQDNLTWLIKTEIHLIGFKDVLVKSFCVLLIDFFS